MKYTEEDILVLKKMLKWYVNGDAGTDIANAWFSDITSATDYTIRLYSGKVTKQLNDLNEPHNPWGKFLYNVPIEDVPLYVNSVPEIAKWRLMINK